MKRHFPIDTLIQMAESEAELTAINLGEMQTACAAAHRQLTDLQKYRLEYAQRLDRELRAGIKAGQLANYNSFIAVLDQSLEQQQQACIRADARRDMARVQWQESQRKLAGYRTLGDRIARQTQVEQGRRDQRASDEQAARMFLDQRGRDAQAVPA
jgi:flagellar FliJ protein